MMNVVALSWLLLSLVTAVVWTPESNQQVEQKTPAKLNEEPRVLMREGHRVFVIEYEREGVLDAAKKGTQDTIHTAADLAKATGENIRHGADKAKEAVKSTADKASHAVKDKASSLLHGTEKETDRDETVKNAYVPMFGQRQGQNGESKVERAENETLKSVGEYIQAAGDSVKDAAQKLSDVGSEKTERIRDIKDKAGESYKEKLDSVKEKAKDLSETVIDTPTEKIKETAGNAYGKVSGTGEKLKETVGETYESAKDKVAGAGLKVKETVKESFDSVKGKVSDTGEKMKDFAEKTRVGMDGVDEQRGDVWFDPVGEDGGDIRIRQALRHAGEAAIERFRQAMDEAYRMTTTGEVLRRARTEVDRRIIPVLSEDAKDAKLNVEGAAIRTADLVKDAATNLSSGSSKGFRVTVYRIGRWTSKESLKVGARMLHLFAFSTIYGSSIWVNFLAGHVMAKAIPRQQFGFVQSKMYPVYFKTMVYGLATSLLAHVALHPWKSDAKIQRWQDYNLLFSLALTLLNMLLLEPRATKAMFEKLRIEKEEGRGTDVADIRGNSPSPCNEDDVKCRMVEVERKLKLVHRISSTVNMLTLMSLTWHLAYLSSFIKS